MLKGVVLDLFGTLVHRGRDTRPNRQFALSACPERLIDSLSALPGWIRRNNGASASDFAREHAEFHGISTG